MLCFIVVLYVYCTIVHWRPSCNFMIWGICGISLLSPHSAHRCCHYHYRYSVTSASTCVTVILIAKSQKYFPSKSRKRQWRVSLRSAAGCAHDCDSASFRYYFKDHCDALKKWWISHCCFLVPFLSLCLSFVRSFVRSSTLHSCVSVSQSVSLTVYACVPMWYEDIRHCSRQPQIQSQINCVFIQWHW